MGRTCPRVQVPESKSAGQPAQTSPQRAPSSGGEGGTKSSMSLYDVTALGAGNRHPKGGPFRRVSLLGWLSSPSCSPQDGRCPHACSRNSTSSPLWTEQLKVGLSASDLRIAPASHTLAKLRPPSFNRTHREPKAYPHRAAGVIPQGPHAAHVGCTPELCPH